MTAKEAKTKWCPFSRVALSEGMAANRTASMGKGGYADIAEETRCIASDCMAWQWHTMDPPVGDCGLKR
jgi:hypothetical protein